MTVQTHDSKFALEKWIVSPTLSSGATHTTITAAMAAASSGDDIFIRSGTYTENFTLKAGVNLISFSGNSLTPSVTIVGKITMTAAGESSISGIRLQTNSDNFLSITGSNAVVLNLINCYLNCTNATGISDSNTSTTHILRLRNCLGDIGTTGITYFSLTGDSGTNNTGGLYISNSILSNSGASSTVSASTRFVKIENSTLYFPINVSLASLCDIYNCAFDTSAINTACVDYTGSVNSSFIFDSYLSSGTATPITINVGGAARWNVYSSSLKTSNDSAISGTGRIYFAQVCVSPAGQGTIGGTLFPAVSQNGVIRNDKQAAFLTTKTTAQDNLTGDGTAATISWNNEIFDQSSSLSGSTFTAPYTGRYLLSASVNTAQIGAGMTSGNLSIVTSANTYVFSLCNPVATADAGAFKTFGGCVFANMTAADTATVVLTITGGTRTVDLVTDGSCFFSGFMVC